MGAEVDKTSLAYKLSKIDNMSDFLRFISSWKGHRIQFPGIEFKRQSLLPHPKSLRGPGVQGKTVLDIINYPPYPKEKLERIMERELVRMFLDSDDETITTPILDPEYLKDLRQM